MFYHGLSLYCADELQLVVNAAKKLSVTTEVPFRSGALTVIMKNRVRSLLIDQGGMRCKHLLV